MGQFRHHHIRKSRTMALFWLRTSHHAQRYMFQRYMLRSLLKQSFNIVHAPIILLFFKKWVPGFAAEDNTTTTTTTAAAAVTVVVVVVVVVVKMCCYFFKNSHVTGEG